MTALKDLKVIFELISECIYFSHPLILDIRWLFHTSLSEIDNNKIWDSRERWEKYVSDRCKYTLFDFLQSFFLKEDFRKNIIAVFEYEVIKCHEKKIESWFDENN